MQMLFVLVLTAQKRHCALLLLPLLFSEPVEEWFVVNKVSNGVVLV
jgi:hypothetical protein